MYTHELAAPSSRGDDGSSLTGSELGLTLPAVARHNSVELRFAAQRVGAPFSPRERCRKDDRLPHQTSGYPARIRRPQQQGIRMFESAAVHPSLPVTVELKETPIRNATTEE
ncbi:unnamed protein product [Sphagnum tenellum]